MGYLGNQPAESFASFEKQVFTIVNSQTAYTLNHAVTNENDIRLVINSVVQEPGSGKAYTAFGTTLTLSAALTNGTDTMYCVFLGRALQTVNPPNASVGTAQIANLAVTSGKLASGVLPTNTPAFEAYLGGSGGQSVSDNTVTLVQANTEVYDTDSAYDTSTYRFNPQTAGKYLVYGSILAEVGSSSNMNENYIYIKKNGSNVTEYEDNFESNPVRLNVINVNAIVDMNGSSDYLELYGRINSVSGSGQLFESDSQYKRATAFGAYKIIT